MKKYVKVSGMYEEIEWGNVWKNEEIRGIICEKYEKIGVKMKKYVALELERAKYQTKRGASRHKPLHPI